MRGNLPSWADMLLSNLIGKYLAGMKYQPCLISREVLSGGRRHKQAMQTGSPTRLSAPHTSHCGTLRYS